MINKFLFSVSIGVLSAMGLAGQGTGAVRDSLDFSNMTLEQLMNVEVRVASHTALNPREAPGILTIITREEIQNSGATDLIEVFSRVPGFDFGVDVEGVVGMGVRGNWAHEGKVLMLWDGYVLNEDLYSTLQFGGHYPVDQIKRIEIIRGPGSSMYGGNAEYAVINIVTINNEELEGASVSTSYGAMSKTFADRNASLSVGQQLGAAHINLSAYTGESNRSQRTYADNYGNQYDMAANSRIRSSQYRMDLRLKGLTLSGMADSYSLNQADGYDGILSHTYPTSFTSYFTSASYDWKPDQKLTITPSIRYKHQEPWSYEGTSFNDEFTPFNVGVDNYRGLLTINYDLNRDIHLLSGAEYSDQEAIEHEDSTYFSNGEQSFHLKNKSAYIQGLFKTGIANFTVGARYNQSNQFDASFVPRAGITRTFEKWHFKALYSKAFRAPSIENINFGKSVRPENTTVVEFETGYKLGKSAYLTTNIYDITTKDAIVFYYDEANEDAYINLCTGGTRGAEMEFRWKRSFGYINMDYAFYTTEGKKKIKTYSAQTRNGLLYAFPAHKISVNGNIQLSPRLSISPALTWQSERCDAYYTTTDTDLHERIYPAVMYADLFFNINHFILPLSKLQIGCKNITDQEVEYIQPYNSNHAPLPGASRTFRIKWTLDLPFSH